MSEQQNEMAYKRQADLKKSLKLQAVDILGVQYARIMRFMKQAWPGEEWGGVVLC